MNIPIFLFFYTLQIFLTFPTFYNTCENKSLYSYFLYFTHHALDVFLFWAIFFLRTKIEYFIHILFVFIVFVHWIFYDNKCISTVWMNRECGYPEEQWLDSLKNMFHFRELNEYFHFIWVGLLLIYDVYKII